VTDCGDARFECCGEALLTNSVGHGALSNSRRFPTFGSTICRKHFETMREIGCCGWKIIPDL
jgi:hypothetical protein